MWHSCVSSSPGGFVPATVFLLGKRELWDTLYFLDRRFRGSAPPSAGFASLWSWPLLQRGEASCYIRLI